jgi:hypothetical protein
MTYGFLILGSARPAAYSAYSTSTDLHQPLPAYLESCGTEGLFVTRLY